MLLLLGAPEGLLELEIMTKKIGTRKNGVLGMCVRHVKQLPLGDPEGLLELEIMTEKIGMRKNTHVCWVCELDMWSNYRSRFPRGCLMYKTK